ncbi:MAG: hypothetical protein K8R23_03675 [Chthoniobacter sp.]|nr:hypothetical protein [Chthoniobacter sp.]
MQFGALITPLLAFLGLITFAAAGPVFEVVASFEAWPQYPSGAALVLGPDGYFWGITQGDGRYGFGTIYKVKADGSAWRTVLSFTDNGKINKGREPFGALLYDGASNVWGTTRQGGKGDGTIWKVNVKTGMLTTVAESFGKGANPGGKLCPDGAGNLWGTTSRGGTDKDSGVGAPSYGTIFKINTRTGTLTTVVEFSDREGPNFGRQPNADLVSDAIGFLWGTTHEGGAGLGTVFKVHAATGKLTTVAEFTGFVSAKEDFWRSGGLPKPGTSAYERLVKSATKGERPTARLESDGAGFLWGTAVGAIFKINIKTGVLTTVSTKVNPQGGLVCDGHGALWGTSGNRAHESGTIFKINALTGDVTTVLEFPKLVHPDQSEHFVKLVWDGADSLWGTVSNPTGADSRDYIIRINPASAEVKTVVEFPETDPRPHPELVSDGAGFLWGTTQRNQWGDGFDPNRKVGTVFKINAATGALTTVADFRDARQYGKGRLPNGGLVDDGAGFLWGTTIRGGTYDLGTVFKVNPITGALSTVAEFAGAAEIKKNANGAIEPPFPPRPLNKGAFPISSLENDGTGFLIGTTRGQKGSPPMSHARWPGYPSTHFKLNPSTGELITVEVNESLQGRFGFVGSGKPQPDATLTADGAGFSWGTLKGGGASKLGSLFKVNASTGEVTTILDFTDKTGFGPFTKLVSDGAGNVWGTTENGGPRNGGTIFKVNTTTGKLTTVIAFTRGDPRLGLRSEQGFWPFGTLMKYTDGNLYGTTTDGGSSGRGAVFRLRFGPTPVTLPATQLGATSATLHGVVTPNGIATSAGFDWGTDPKLARSTLASAGSIAASATSQPISSSLTGLTPGTTYFFRARGSNRENSIPQLGDILSFTTPEK